MNGADFRRQRSFPSASHSPGLPVSHSVTGAARRMSSATSVSSSPAKQEVPIGKKTKTKHTNKTKQRQCEPFAWPTFSPCHERRSKSDFKFLVALHSQVQLNLVSFIQPSHLMQISDIVMGYSRRKKKMFLLKKKTVKYHSRAVRPCYSGH